MEILKTAVRCLGWGALIVLSLSASAGNKLYFLVGICIFFAIYPLITKITKRLNSGFEAEFAIATGFSILTLFLLGALLPPDTDQSRLVVLAMFALGIRLVFFPLYNTDGAETGGQART